jgi:two-component system, NarL family, response regulator DesR
MKLYLVEDQNLVRDALVQLLNLQPDMEVIGSAANGQLAQTELLNLDVDIVLADIEMPQCDGLTLCAWLQQQRAQIKVVILTTFDRSGYVQRAIHAGAWGFILKEVPVDTLAVHLRTIASGRKVFDSELVLASLGNQDPLNERERQALRLAELGLSTTVIAQKMCLSEGTVRNYLSESISKLYATSRIQAANIARQKGWL